MYTYLRTGGVVLVHGAAHATEKEMLLIELAHVLNNNNLQFIIEGDFDIIRESGERNKRRE